LDARQERGGLAAAEKVSPWLPTAKSIYGVARANVVDTFNQIYEGECKSALDK
jgi:hypothetical protein